LKTIDVDIAIVGAGPAGSTTAIGLSDTSLRIALIDKEAFPRDKICGDALSPDVVKQLHMLPLETGALFDEMKEKLWCRAVRFVSPSFGYADLELPEKHGPGYISQRVHFDHFMYNQAIKNTNVQAIHGHKVTGLETNEDGAQVTLSDGTVIRAQVVLGADGAQSIVKRTLVSEAIDRKHHAAALRVYYENVTGFSEDNAVELHFYSDILPGYFWVFPLPDNKANVGIGMSSEHVAKHKVNLRELMDNIIANHPNVAPRFANAKPLETPKGFSLPLGSRKRQLSGNRFLLLGDAASLINPLTGEGIANAIRSGRVASDVLRQSFDKKQFNANYLKAYDKEIYRRMWGELRLNLWLRMLMSYPRLCTLVIRHAVGSRWIQKLFLSGF